MTTNYRNSSSCCNTRESSSSSSASSNKTTVSFVKFTRVVKVGEEVKENPARINAAAVMGYFPRKALVGAQSYLRLVTGEEVNVKETTTEIDRKLSKAGATIIE